MKYLNFRSSASKLEGIACKFTKSSTPSEVVFEEFHYKCRTAILKNASRWLLLGTTLFLKYSSMAASQRQLQSIFILEILGYTCMKHNQGQIYSKHILVLRTDTKYFLKRIGAGTCIIKMKLTSKFPTIWIAVNITSSIRQPLFHPMTRCVFSASLVRIL